MIKPAAKAARPSRGEIEIHLSRLTRKVASARKAPHSLGRLKLEAGNESAELVLVRYKRPRCTKGAVSRNDTTQAHGGIANGQHDSSG